MRWILFFTLSILINFLTATAHAGIMELSGSYGVRNSRIDDDNYTKSETWTGSVAWYFLELSAIELSYTNGTSTQSLKAEGEAAVKYVQEFEMYGADLVLTFAGRDWFVQPFIRGGAARLKKQIYRIEGEEIKKYGEPVDKVVPSYGGGIKVNLAKGFSIKGSYDRWKSGSDTDKTNWDDAVKAGVSWYF